MSARTAALTFGKRAIKLGLLAPAALARSREPGLLLLGYHRIGAGMEREMDVSTPTFREQMRYLAEHREVVPLEDGMLRMGAPLERDLFAITFDDGYGEVYDNAWPVLRELRLPATLFLATGFVEGIEPPPLRAGAGDRGAPPKPLSWKQIEEMRASDLISVGSHSQTHPSFGAISRDRAEEECASSKRMLEERTGGAVASFAYPGGVVAHEEVVAAHYRYGVAADGGKNRPSALTPLRLSRVPVRASDGMFFFRRRLSGLAPLEDRLYDRLRSARD